MSAFIVAVSTASACASAETAPSPTSSIATAEAPPRTTPICVGAETLPSEGPRDFACCHPALDAYRRTFRTAEEGLRRCYVSSAARDRSVRVAFRFRIEADGSVLRVCSDGATTLDDDPSLSCMLDEVQRLRFPATSVSEVAHCGLVSLSYPVQFDP